jgi:hypothetical protein
MGSQKEPRSLPKSAGLKVRGGGWDLPARKRLIFVGCSRKPLGDGVRNHLGRERSHLSKVRITNYLSLNSLPLRLQIVFCLLQLSYQPVNFCNRRGCDLLNERSNLRVRFWLRRKFCMSEITNFAFNNQIRG